MVGSSPSGTLATSRPMANISASVSGRPTATPTTRNTAPMRDRDCGDQPGDPLDLLFQRAGVAAGALTQCGDAAESPCGAGGEHDRLGLASGAGRAAEDEVGLLQQRRPDQSGPATVRPVPTRR